MDCRLPSTLAAVYGVHLTCRLAWAQAHLLVSIADSLLLLLPNYANLPASVALLSISLRTVHRVNPSFALIREF